MCRSMASRIARTVKTKMPPFHRYSPEARYCAAVGASGFSTNARTRAAPPSMGSPVRM